MHPKFTPRPSDEEMDKLLNQAGVGGESIELRKIGTLAGMNLYVDLGQQPDSDVAYKKATALLYRAFVSKQEKK